MKKKIKVEVVDYGKEKRKEKRRERVQKFVENSKKYAETGFKCLAFGVGVGMAIALNQRYS